MHTPADRPAQTAAPAVGSPARARLIALNLALLLMLGAVTLVTSLDAGAQPGAVAPPIARPRGDYTMVSGRYQGGVSNAVWILDATNQELLALSWDRSRTELEVIGHRRLMDDAQIRQGR